MLDKDSKELLTFLTLQGNIDFYLKVDFVSMGEKSLFYVAVTCYKQDEDLYMVSTQLDINEGAFISNPTTDWINNDSLRLRRGHLDDLCTRVFTTVAEMEKEYYDDNS